MQFTPEYLWQGPMLGPVGLTLPGGADISRRRLQNVPGSAIPGLYLYRGYVGVYESRTAWDSSGFFYTKTGSDTGASGIVGDWACTGDPFPGEEGGAKTAPPPEDGRGNTPALRISPNPFNPLTTITLTLPQAEWVKVEAYDLAGRRVPGLGARHASPLQAEGRWYAAGIHTLTFDGSALPSGVYLLRVEVSGLRQPRLQEVRKLILLK
jgi:hypothetical protein